MGSQGTKNKYFNYLWIWIIPRFGELWLWTAADAWKKQLCSVGGWRVKATWRAPDSSGESCTESGSWEVRRGICNQIMGEAEAREGSKEKQASRYVQCAKYFDWKQNRKRRSLPLPLEGQWNLGQEVSFWGGIAQRSWWHRWDIRNICRTTSIISWASLSSHCLINSLLAYLIKSL